MKKLLKSLTLSFLSAGAVIAISSCGGGGGSSSNSGDIIHNGVTYKTVKSPATGRVWLDRNIGAAQVCTAYNDVACYGDYFQWGRNADGHEDSNSGTTTAQATSVDDVGHSLFIVSKSTSNKYDWAYSADSDGVKREANWSKTDGSSVCPKGFRVPTKAELKAEIDGLNIQNRDGAFNSFLKLPSAGYRSSWSGDLSEIGHTLIWTSSAVNNRAYRFSFDESKVYKGGNARANGESVRCIKE